MFMNLLITFQTERKMQAMIISHMIQASKSYRSLHWMKEHIQLFMFLTMYIIQIHIRLKWQMLNMKLNSRKVTMAKKFWLNKTLLSVMKLCFQSALSKEEKTKQKSQSQTMHTLLLLQQKMLKTQHIHSLQLRKEYTLLNIHTIMVLTNHLRQLK